MAQAAEAGCQALTSAQDDMLVALASQTSDDQLLQVSFEDGTYCIIEREGIDLDDIAGSALHLNSSLDEIAVLATLDGVDAWLRVDYLFSGAMILDRATGEELGLTDAEFLGDNSLLEASDFFIEYVYSFEIGEFEIDDVEVNIPRLDAAYDHYADRDPRPAMTDPEAEFLTVGSIGEALLEKLSMTFDFANEKIYATEAN